MVSCTKEFQWTVNMMEQSNMMGMIGVVSERTQKDNKIKWNHILPSENEDDDKISRDSYEVYKGPPHTKCLVTLNSPQEFGFDLKKCWINERKMKNAASWEGRTVTFWRGRKQRRCIMQIQHFLFLLCGNTIRTFVVYSSRKSIPFKLHCMFDFVFDLN